MTGPPAGGWVRGSPLGLATSLHTCIRAGQGALALRRGVPGGVTFLGMGGMSALLEAFLEGLKPARALHLQGCMSVFKQVRGHAVVLLGLAAGGSLMLPCLARAEALPDTPASCTDVDLGARVPDMSMGSARLQSTGWCFALAAADLISIRTGQAVSGSALALAYYNHAPVVGEDVISTLRNYGHSWWTRHSFKSTNREGGFSERVLQTAINDGFVCSEASFPSQYGDAGQLSMDSYIELLDAVESAHEDLRDINPEELPHEGSCTSELSKRVEAAKILFPRLDLEDLVKVARRSESETFLYELSRWGCDAIPLRGNGGKPLKVRHLALSKRTDRFEMTAGRAGVAAIHEQLSRSNPVMIAYPGEALTDPRFAIRTSRKLKNIPDMRANHASVLVGRRWNPEAQNGRGECEYQLKNSWGTGCSSYHKSLDCDRGVVWVGSEFMSDLIDQVTWLE